jgi:hypothetical protein
MLRLFDPRRPGPGEESVFSSFAVQATGVGLLLGHCPPASDEESEVLTATLDTAATEYLQSGEDPLALLEWLEHAEGPNPQVELAVQLLHAITVCELLQYESRERFARYLPLRTLADEATRALAGGYVRLMGGELPRAVKRAFPRVARYVREAARMRMPQQRSLLRRCLDRVRWPTLEEHAAR